MVYGSGKNFKSGFDKQIIQFAVDDFIYNRGGGAMG